MIVYFFSAWAWTPPYITENVCTLRRQGNIHMAGYGAQLNTTLSLSRESRRMRGFAAVGHPIEWVT